MRTVLAAILWLIVSVASAQKEPVAFKSDLYTKLIYSDTTICAKIKTIWAMDDSAFCVGWPETKEMHCYLKVSVVESSEQNTRRIIAVDTKTKQRHSITLVLTDIGFSIFISNLDKGFPHMIISTHDICAHNKSGMYETKRN